LDTLDPPHPSWSRCDNGLITTLTDEENASLYGDVAPLALETPSHVSRKSTDINNPKISTADGVCGIPIVLDDNHASFVPPWEPRSCHGAKITPD